MTCARIPPQLAIIVAISLLLAHLSAQSDEVEWLSDPKRAELLASTSNRPLLTLTQAGEEPIPVFGHPLLVDATKLFVPLQLRGDAGPSRLQVRGGDAIAEFGLAAVTKLMVEGLRRAELAVPPYLDLLAREESARATEIETAVFGMG